LVTEKKLNEKSLDIERHKDKDAEKEVKSKSLEVDIQQLDKGLQAEKGKLN
jgi:hypothetical protein